MTDSHVPAAAAPVQLRPVDRYTLGDAILAAWHKHGNDSWCSIADEVIAALAAPQQGAPSDRIRQIAADVEKCALSWDSNARLLGNVTAEDIVDLCNAVLTRYSAQAVPVAVSERLPEEGDCAPWSDDPDATPPDSFVGRMLRPSADDVTWDTPKEVRMIGARITDAKGEPIMDISFDPEPEPLPLCLWQILAPVMDDYICEALRAMDDPDAEQEAEYPACRQEVADVIEALRDWLLPEEPEPVEPLGWELARWDERQRLRALLTAQARIARGDSNG